MVNLILILLYHRVLLCQTRHLSHNHIWSKSIVEFFVLKNNLRRIYHNYSRRCSFDIRHKLRYLLDINNSLNKLFNFDVAYEKKKYSSSDQKNTKWIGYYRNTYHTLLMHYYNVIGSFYCYTSVHIHCTFNIFKIIFLAK
jgi:hypothetical protein